LDIVSRLCVQLAEKEDEDAITLGTQSTAVYAPLRVQIEEVFGLLAKLCPSMEQVSNDRLLYCV
jgi:hypothetical protein